MPPTVSLPIIFALVAVKLVAVNNPRVLYPGTFKFPLTLTVVAVNVVAVVPCNQLPPVTTKLVAVNVVTVAPPLRNV